MKIIRSILVCLNILMVGIYLIFLTLAKLNLLHNPYKFIVLEYYGNILFLIQIITLLLCIAIIRKLQSSRWKVSCHLLIIVAVFAAFDWFVNSTLFLFQTF